MSAIASSAIASGDAHGSPVCTVVTPRSGDAFGDRRVTRTLCAPGRAGRFVLTSVGRVGRRVRALDSRCVAVPDVNVDACGEEERGSEERGVEARGVGAPGAVERGAEVGKPTPPDALPDAAADAVTDAFADERPSTTETPDAPEPLSPVPPATWIATPPVVASPARAVLDGAVTVTVVVNGVPVKNVSTCPGESVSEWLAPAAGVTETVTAGPVAASVTALVARLRCAAADVGPTCTVRSGPPPAPAPTSTPTVEPAFVDVAPSIPALELISDLDSPTVPDMSVIDADAGTDAPADPDADVDADVEEPIPRPASTVAPAAVMPAVVVPVALTPTAVVPAPPTPA